MAKVTERAKIGTDGQPLPILPPVRDARVLARMVRVLFYTPGFLALKRMQQDYDARCPKPL